MSIGISEILLILTVTFVALGFEETSKLFLFIMRELKRIRKYSNEALREIHEDVIEPISDDIETARRKDEFARKININLIDVRKTINRLIKCYFESEIENSNSNSEKEDGLL